jgi:hypothetical protein
MRRSESVDVRAELGMVLEEEAARRVRVDLQTRPRDQAGQQIRLAREDHRVAIAAGDECGLVDRQTRSSREWFAMTLRDRQSGATAGFTQLRRVAGSVP